jgi:redox-sensitive bicupin YhaK (pirin superfamily)
VDDGRDGSLTIHQDVDLYATALERGERVSLALRSGRGVWVQVAAGELSVNGQQVRAGDGIEIGATDEVRIEGHERTEALVFDMAL